LAFTFPSGGTNLNLSGQGGVAVGALPKPDLPEGPVRVLSDRLHELHHRAGWPSLRLMAREVGCSHTTIAAAFSDRRVPRWGLLELIVETLGGDAETFHGWWLAATGAAVGPNRPSTALPPTGPEPPPPRPPRQLPASVPGFVGRECELAAMDDLLARDRDGPRVAVVVGTAGVGKTALVLVWAHRIAERFPDGQLYLDLRGFDPDAPLTTGEALEVLLRSLGVQGSAIPQRTAERAAAYRSLLADRQLLVVLDNAHREEQVRDLLPGSPDCVALVTSRTSMSALVAREGALRVNVDLLPDREAHALLRRLVGPRVDDEPAATHRLAQQCARLPLALRIAAELAASRPSTSLVALSDELEDEPQRLDMLRVADDEYTAVRGVFSWSWRHLDETSTLAFRLLGLHAGREIGLAAAAALLGDDTRLTRTVLSRLIRASLLEEVSPDRFAMHDLLRGYAIEEATLLDRAAAEDALTRLESHYINTATAAMTAAYGAAWRPVRQSARPSHPPTAATSPDPDSGRTWLTTEWAAVVAQALSSPASRFDFVADAATTLADHLDDTAHFDQADRLHGHVRRLAVQLRRPAEKADALNSLAVILRRRGKYDEAVALHEEALSTYREIGDLAGEARALHRRGVLDWRRGRYDDARIHLVSAVDLYARSGDDAGQGAALYALGIALRRLGRYADAVEHHGRAIDLLRQVGDRRGEAAARTNMGVAFMYLGRYPEATEQFDAGLHLHLALDHPIGVAVCWDNLGSVASRQRRFEDALRHHTDALHVCETLGYPAGQGDARRGLGVALAGLGRHDEARVQLERALEIGENLGEAAIVTQSLCDLASLHLSCGELDQARLAWQRARDLASSSGDPYDLARALAGLSELDSRRGDSRSAQLLHCKAREIFAELGVAESGHGV
jgi:tetratricopeptide (TPR) repeat protein